MKKSIYVLMALLAAAGCHSGHDHGSHEHSVEGHAHDHDAHSGHVHAEADHNHDHSSEGHSHEEAAEAGHNPLEITFDAARQAMFGVRSEAVKAQPFSQIIHVGGSVLPAIGDESIAIAPVAGIITFSGRTLTEGTAVRSGTVIAGISTRAVAGGDVEAKLRAAFEAAKKEYERDAAMVAENIVSESHFEQSKLAYEQAKAEYEAISAASLTGGGAAEKSGEVAVKSPLSGYVNAIYVTSGQYVEAGTAIAAISQNRTLRLRADVPDRYASSLRTITDAHFTTASGQTYSVKELGGKVSSYGRVSEAGYIPVTFEFPNRAEIVPGSFVDIYLKGGTSSPQIVLPNSAIIEEQGVYSVFVRLSEGGHSAADLHDEHAHQHEDGHVHKDGHNHEHAHADADLHDEHAHQHEDGHVHKDGHNHEHAHADADLHDEHAHQHEDGHTHEVGDCFMKREVRIGASDGVRTVILSGIAEGEDVVVSGAMQIKLASLSAIPSGHNHNH